MSTVSASHDVLIKCHLNASDNIGHFVNERIQRVNGTTGTMITIVFNAFV
jgi:hypothetical protein